MKILILGGGGFIGAHLGKRLHQNGHTVKLIDINFPAYRDQWYFMKNSGSLNADLRNADEAAYAVAGFGKPDLIFQLAADMGGVEYFHSDKDWSAALNNGLINHQVMKAVSKYASSARVVFTSTACALNTRKQTHRFVKKHGGPYQLTEDDLYTGTPDQLYGQEKRNSAIMWDRSALDTRVVFLHTVYGPGQEFEGQRMKFPMAVSQKARRARQSGKLELLGDGKQIRTFLYIDDAVDRLIAVAHSPVDPGPLNIGSSIPYHCDTVAGFALAAAGVPLGDVRLEYVNGPTGVEARSCSNKKFHETIGKSTWLNNTTLSHGLRKTVEWLDEVSPL